MAFLGLGTFRPSRATPISRMRPAFVAQLGDDRPAILACGTARAASGEHAAPPWCQLECQCPLAAHCAGRGMGQNAGGPQRAGLLGPGPGLRVQVPPPRAARAGAAVPQWRPPRGATWASGTRRPWPAGDGARRRSPPPEQKKKGYMKFRRG